MEYKSFIRFLAYIQPETTDFRQADFVRLKKLATAEFNQAPDGIIRIDGIDYTRHVILGFFENPDLPNFIRLDSLVYERRDLLHFLEFQTLDREPTEVLWYNLHKEPGFTEYISPFFAPAFNKVMGKYIQEFNFGEATVWYSFHKLMEEQHSETGFSSIRIFLKEGSRFFRNMNADTFKEYDTELNRWKKSSWGNFLDHIYFDHEWMIEDLAAQVINFTVLIQKQDAKLCLLLTKQLKNIENLSEDTRKIVKGNYNFFNQKANTGSAGSFRYLYIVFIIFVVVRALNCNSSHNSSYDNFQRIQLEIPKLNYDSLVEFDSNFRKIYKLDLPKKPDTSTFIFKAKK